MGGPEVYSEEFSARVYSEVLRRAGRVLESGRSVILDTTFTSRALRARARELAQEHGARFVFVECRAPAAVLRERLRSRKSGLSDAREDLLDRFLERFEPATDLPPGELVVVDTTRPPDAAVEQILRQAGA
jgi:predicted kinase